MKPSERKQFDLEIYTEIGKPENRGCYEDAADFLRLPGASKLSKIFNPYDPRANNVFGESLDILEAFHDKYPTLARFIWEKMNLKVNKFMSVGEREIGRGELVEIADSTAREQLDVNFAISSGKTLEEIEIEAFQAVEKSRVQYDAIVDMRKRSCEKEQIQAQNFGHLKAN